MASRVGAKGNIVIDKQIRDQLGVKPGWEAVQLLRDGHVEIHFLPPVEPGSSLGRLRPGPGVDGSWLADDDSLHEAKERALGEAMAAKFGAAGRDRRQ
jgi:bifunctional DNA-binding transcriptional regulator/antitoxin component of YhaV-PrlF toxin-antitoxin module